MVCGKMSIGVRAERIRRRIDPRSTMLGWNAKAVGLWFKKCPTSALTCKDHLTATTIRIREPYYYFDG